MFQYGLYQFPFQVMLPNWLPDSMMCGEPHASILMQVKYRLTAQLEGMVDEDWVAGLPMLGMSRMRHELPLFINRDPAM